MFQDRVYETSTSTGKAALTLAGAATGYRTFSAAFGTNAAYYCIVNRDVPAEWEVGSFTVAGATMTRAAANVLASSAGAGVLVTFTAGTKDIFNAPPANAMSLWEAGRISNVSGGISATSLYAITAISLTKTGSTLILNASQGACFSSNCACTTNCACACRC